jgi:hypothetical protein
MNNETKNIEALLNKFGNFNANTEFSSKTGSIVKISELSEIFKIKSTFNGTEKIISVLEFVNNYHKI